MLGTGQSRHNTHIGQTTIRQGNLIIDGKVEVSGDLEVDGTLVFNGDFTINPPGCLNTDCVNSVSDLGITVSDNLNINSTKNLSTNNINPATPATGIQINNEYKLPIVKGTTNQVLKQVDALGNCEFGDIPNSSTTIPLDWRLIWLGQGRTQYTNNIFQSLVSIQPIGSRPTLNNSNFLRDAILFQESTGRIEVVYDGSNSATWQFKFSYLNDGISVDGFSENLIYTQNVNGYYKFRHYIYNLVVSTGTYPRLYSLVQLEVPDPSDPNKRYLASWINEDATTNNGQFPDTSGVLPNDTSITQYDLQAQKIVSGTSTSTLYPDGINIWIGANLTVSASGGVGGVVTNPLTENLVLGGFSIIEPLGAISPSLNIDQLDITKDIKLKVGGLSKVDVKDNEIQLNENLNMTQKQINDVSLITNTTAPLGLVGQSGTSAVVLDPDPSNSFNVLGQSDIKLQSNTDVILQSNTGFVDLNSNITRVNVGGITKLQVDASETTSSNNINMGDNDIGQCGNLEVSTINNLSPVGGLFSGISDSLNVSATTAEISILPLTFVGTGFSVSPNGFSVGDTFRLELSGPFNSNNNDTLTIRLKAGPASTTLLSTLVVPLNASSGSVFQLSALFQIRAIGGAGVADIISDADLTYNQSGAGGSFVGEQSLSQNNTTFATNVANVLDVTAQFSSTSANNDMTTRLSKLNKVF